jgi:SAM-dependent methyltransferase
MDDFNAEKYWRARLGKCSDIHGTGLLGAPLAWQRWLYRGKERAYLKLLKRAGVEIRGCQVLDFGCGTGYFENFWEGQGARRADGLDIVPEVIERLQREHPNRKYVCADLSKDPSQLVVFGSPQLVTAIDVLYHIVDDDALLPILRALTSIMEPGAYFLFTDKFKEVSNCAPHVRFRSLDQWLRVLSEIGLELEDREPVCVVNNRLLRGVKWLPGLMGAAQHYLDVPFLRLFPNSANVWVALAQRSGGP